MPADLPAFN